MTTAAVTKWLMALAISFSGYEPTDAPAVKYVSSEYLRETICMDVDYNPSGQIDSELCNVQSFYYNGVIYLDRNLDIINNPYHRSFLLHDMVHHLQAVNNFYTAATYDKHIKDCREVEAFRVQNAHLTQIEFVRPVPVGPYSSC